MRGCRPEVPRVELVALDADDECDAAVLSSAAVHGGGAEPVELTLDVRCHGCIQRRPPRLRHLVHPSWTPVPRLLAQVVVPGHQQSFFINEPLPLPGPCTWAPAVILHQ